MVLQEYMLHLVTGEVILALEPLEKEEPAWIIRRFLKGDPDTVVCTGDVISGLQYIPVRSIVYISTGERRVIEETLPKDHWLSDLTDRGAVKENTGSGEAFHGKN